MTYPAQGSAFPTVAGYCLAMSDGIENRRLVELLYLRDRSLRKLRHSTSLHEVWALYQEVQFLSQHIERLEKTRHAVSA